MVCRFVAGDDAAKSVPCLHEAKLYVQARVPGSLGNHLLVGTDLCSVVEWCQGCGALFLDRHRRLDAAAYERGRAAGFVEGQEWAGY